MKRRAFFGHSSELPLGRAGAALSPERAATRSLGEIERLRRRVRAAAATSTSPEEARLLRRLAEDLGDATFLHTQAVRYEALVLLVDALRLMNACFGGPLQSAVADGQEVPLAALDAEITATVAARKKLRELTRPLPGVMHRKTLAAASKVAARAEERLAKRSGPNGRDRR
ncbi:MAG: hypothetical protein JST00_29515 [Deltaproteobacteria bacterium]|nr:hypothetical protein [Deltaproteobacteria bacterium]